MPDFARLDRLLARQHGVVSIDQLAGLGMSRGQAASWAKRGLFEMFRRGVMRACGARQTWKMAASAAILAAGEGAVLSHRSAARLWGLEGSGNDDLIEITAPRQKRLAGVRAHRHAYSKSEVTVRDGIPVTTVERTLLDMAEWLDEGELGQQVDEALRRRLVTLEQVRATLGPRATPGRRRWRPMRGALGARGVGYDPGANNWEQRMDRQWDEWGLPPGPRQHRVRVPGGRSYVVDRAIVELRVGIEWNGRARHGTRSGFEHDSRRRGELLRAGWMILDFTPGNSRRHIVATVRAACEERRRLLLSA